MAATMTPEAAWADRFPNLETVLARRLWPTPNKMDAVLTASPERWRERQEEKARQGINLQSPLSVAVKMWPTPTKADADGGVGWSGREGGLNLRTAVRREMFPTPTVNDNKNDNPPLQALRNTPPLNVVVGGQMNPTWVEWLMGWPLGWTDLRVSATDRFRQWCASHGVP